MRRIAKSQAAFTLIEVTLAIVIGVIMIAGAVLIYNQAKTSSGNSRAQAKVLALQQVVEEFASNNAGTYPTISDARALFKRKRPDDYLKSPWGGQIGTHLQQADDTAARGIADHSEKDRGTGDGAGTESPWGTTDVAGLNKVSAEPLKVKEKNGGLAYSLNNDSTGTEGQDNTETKLLFDVVTNNTKEFRGYALWVYDQQGRYPNFSTGGAVGARDTTSAAGGVQD